MIPVALEKLLGDPILVQHFSKSFSTAILPSLEASLTQVLKTRLLPNLEKAMAGMVISTAATLEKERVKDRQEREEGRAEVRELKAQMGVMTDSLLRLERLLMTPPSAATPVATTYATSPLESSKSSEPDLESLFTAALQPNAPPKLLINLIADFSPATVFPGEGAPKISYPVILSLAYRMAILTGETETKSDDSERVILSWIRRSLAALDGKVRPLPSPASPFPTNMR